jgi:hypothetical protein
MLHRGILGDHHPHHRGHPSALGDGADPPDVMSGSVTCCRSLQPRPANRPANIGPFVAACQGEPRLCGAAECRALDRPAQECDVLHRAVVTAEWVMLSTRSGQRRNTAPSWKAFVRQPRCDEGARAPSNLGSGGRRGRARRLEVGAHSGSQREATPFGIRSWSFSDALDAHLAHEQVMLP